MAHFSLQDVLTDPLLPGEDLRWEATKKCFVNETSKREFPLVGGIPFLFREPGASFVEWQARTANFFADINREIQGLESQLAGISVIESTGRRLKKLLAGRIQFRNSCAEILAPLAAQISEEATGYSQLLGRLPGQQRLLGYSQNIFRDWAWGDEENKKAVNLIKSILPESCSFGKLLVEGGGYCRLAYDLHMELKPDLTVASDLNPLLLLSAKKVIFEDGYLLTEFPFPSITAEECAVERRLLRVGEKPKEDQFCFVLCDGVHPPFRESSFDTILTPWFLDIIYQDARDFIPSMAKLLKIGGMWINFGPLLFDHRGAAQKYSMDEIVEIAELSGFEIHAQKAESVPYLDSPSGGHKRYEQVFAFSAKKVREVEHNCSDNNYLPEWILTPSRSIPLSPYLQQYAASQKMMDMILSQINGKRSINDLSQWAAKQFKSDAGAVKKALITYFSDFYDRYKESLFQGLN